MGRTSGHVGTYIPQQPYRNVEAFAMDAIRIFINIPRSATKRRVRARVAGPEWELKGNIILLYYFL